MSEALIASRAQWLGVPNRMLRDAGTSFRGKFRCVVSLVYGVVVIAAPIEGHFPAGKAERQTHIAKKVFEAITDHLGTSVDPHQRLALAPIARNLTPTSGTSIAPSASLTGKINTLDDLQRVSLTKHDSSQEARQYTAWERLGGIQIAQSTILQYVDGRSIRLCVRRNLQVSSFYYLRPGDDVDDWVAKKKAEVHL